MKGFHLFFRNTEVDNDDHHLKSEEWVSISKCRVMLCSPVGLGVCKVFRGRVEFTRFSIIKWCAAL